MALAAGMAMAAPAAASLQHNIKGTQNGFAYAHASVRVSVRVTNASVSAVSYGRFGSSGGAGVLERPGLDQSGTDSTPRTSEGGEMGASKQQVRFGGGERFRVILLDDVRHTESQAHNVLQLQKSFQGLCRKSQLRMQGAVSSSLGRTACLLSLWP